MLKTFLILFSLHQVTYADTTVGQDRKAKIKFPKNYSTVKKWPLLVVLHGYGSYARQQEMYFGASRNMNKLGYVLLLPNGTKNKKGKRFWNATPECCDFDETKIDDAKYLIELIREAKEKYSIDSKRIYIFGHSNGGFMAYRMACDYGNEISGIVSLAGLSFKTGDLCKANGSVKVLHIHGTEDKVIPYYKNDEKGYPGAYEIALRWGLRNQCQNFTKTEKKLHLLINPTGKDTDVLHWDNCTRTATLWRVNKAGHVPPFNKNFMKKVWENISKD